MSPRENDCTVDSTRIHREDNDMFSLHILCKTQIQGSLSAACVNSRARDILKPATVTKLCYNSCGGTMRGGIPSTLTCEKMLKTFTGGWHGASDQSCASGAAFSSGRGGRWAAACR